MNAAEARKLTEENITRLAEKELKEVIADLENRIMINAKDGMYWASNIVSKNSALVKTKLTNKVIEYFENKGFFVEGKDYSIDAYFRFFVSW